MRAPGVVLLIALAAASPSLQQRAPVVSGRVIHSLTGAPLGGAVVAARRSMPGISSGTADTAFLTDASGAFALRDLPAGAVNVTASKTGYLDTHRAAVFTLAPGDRLDDVVIALTPTSLISGRIVDPAGDPVPNAYVRAVEAGSALSSRAGRSTSTDDRGVYVIDGLGAGRYVLGAGRSVVESLEIPDSATVTVEVGTGVELAGPDLAVPFRPDHGKTLLISATGSARTIDEEPGKASIAGTVRNSRGRALAAIMVIAVRDVDIIENDPSTRIWSATTDDRGAFSIQYLPAGSFMVAAGTSARRMFFHGATRPQQPGRPIHVATGERKGGVDITVPVPELGAISGVVRDEFGDPVRASVRLIAAAFPDGLSTMDTLNMHGISIFTRSQLRS